MTALLFVWDATQWCAWHLADQPQLGSPWFVIAGWRVYSPFAFFWWWFSFDAYAHDIFVQGGFIAAAGGIAAFVVAVGFSIWRAREHTRVTTYGSARWADNSDVENANLLAGSGVILGAGKSAISVTTARSMSCALHPPAAARAWAWWCPRS